MDNYVETEIKRFPYDDRLLKVWDKLNALKVIGNIGPYPVSISVLPMNAMVAAVTEG